jgi:putative aldouronate transport system substrate-binding protein
MKTKKLICGIITSLLVSGLALSGCGNKEAAKTTENTAENTTAKTEEKSETKKIENFNEQGFPIVNEKITASMMGFKHPIQGAWDKLKFFKTMEEKTNIAFTFDNPPSDSYTEKKNLAFASGEYPDVFFGGLLSVEDEIKYGQDEKVLIPLNDLIDKYAPNIQKMFAEMPDVKKSITAPDGNIYALPNINQASIATTGTIWVNYEWLDNLGIKELPTTVEGLQELFVKFKNEDPNKNGKQDEIPFSGRNGLGDIKGFFPQGFGILDLGFYVDDSGKVQYGYMNNNFKDYMSYVNKLWSEKLIDQEIFNMTDAELSAKGKANLVGMASHAIPQLIYDCNDVEKAAKYPVLPAMSSKQSPTQLARKGTGINRGQFAITKNAKNTEALIRWVDWLYSEEGSIFIHYGEEGDLWKTNEKGLRVYNIPTDGRSVEERRGGEITPDCGTPLPKWVRNETEGSWDDIAQQTRIKETDEKMFKFAKVPYPLTYFTPDEQKQLNTIMTDINKYVTETEAKFATGQLGIDDGYNSFVETLKKMGIEDAIKIYQDSYDRWKNN